MQDLENKIGEIQVQAEYKLHLHDQDWAEKTKKMKEEMEAARGAAEARFEAGAISALEYADARTRLDNARINALRTQYDFVFKTRILDFYLGRPLSL